MQSQIFWRKKSGRPLCPHPEMDHRTEEQGPHTCITLAETSQECGPICLCWIYSPAILPTTVLWAIKASCSSNSLFCLFFMYYSLKSYLQSVLQLGRNTWSTSFFSNPTYSITFHPLQGLYMCSVQSLSCVWLFVTPWTGFPVHHQLLEFAQTHVHWLSNAIQRYPLSFPSPAFNLSQHQGLFQWVSSTHLVARVLEFQL